MCFSVGPNLILALFRQNIQPNRIIKNPQGQNLPSFGQNSLIWPNLMPYSVEYQAECSAESVCFGRKYQFRTNNRRFCFCSVSAILENQIMVSVENQKSVSVAHQRACIFSLSDATVRCRQVSDLFLMYEMDTDGRPWEGGRERERERGRDDFCG